MELLKDYDNVIPCIEIKAESIECFGVEKCVDSVIQAVDTLISSSILLSFEERAVSYLHGLGITNTGWVLTHYDSATRKRADALKPEVLICAINKTESEEHGLWSGPWKWMLYHSEEPGVIRDCISKGAQYVETDNVKVVKELMPELFDEK